MAKHYVYEKRIWICRCFLRIKTLSFRPNAGFAELLKYTCIQKYCSPYCIRSQQDLFHCIFPTPAAKLFLPCFVSFFFVFLCKRELVLLRSIQIKQKLSSFFNSYLLGGSFRQQCFFCANSFLHTPNETKKLCGKSCSALAKQQKRKVQQQMSFIFPGMRKRAKLDWKCLKALAKVQGNRFLFCLFVLAGLVCTEASSSKYRVFQGFSQLWDT